MWTLVKLILTLSWVVPTLTLFLRGRCTKKNRKKLTNVSLYVCMSAGNSEMLVFLSVFFPNNVEMIMIVMAWWWRYWWWRLWEKGGSLLLSITTPWGRGAPRSTSSNKVDYHHHLRRSFLGSDQKRKTEKLGLFVQIRKDQVLNWGHHHKRLELIWATSSTKKIPHFLLLFFDSWRP